MWGEGGGGGGKLIGFFGPFSCYAIIIII